MTPRIYAYLNERGIRANFNTLGHTPALIHSYIAGTETLLAIAGVTRSNLVKGTCYNKFYKIEERPCINGFEEFEKIDHAYRNKSAKRINTNRPYNAYETIPDRSISSLRPYNQVLKASFAEYNAPILMYLSGGIDSEFVACALLDANIKFTPVIFNWTDASGTVKNSKDTDYAYKFCQAHSLTPIVETVDIETLWGSADFLALGEELQLVSPQLTTHVYMVMRINETLPGRYHLHGGEVRYNPYSSKNSYNEDLTMVYANKTSLDFSGTYSITATRTAPYVPGGLYQSYHTLPIRSTVYSCYWEVRQSSTGPGGTGDMSNSVSGSPLSGYYAVSPFNSTGYQQRWTVQGTPVISGNSSSYTTDTGWIATSFSSVFLIDAADNSGAGTYVCNATYTVDIQPTGGPGIISTTATFNNTLIV